MEKIARIKVGTENISVRRYRRSLEKQVISFFREGYPLSFDGNDLREIRRELRGKVEKTYLLAFRGDNLIGAFIGLSEVPGLCHLYAGGYAYVREDVRHLGIATILVGVAEEILKEKARVVIGTNAGILPFDSLSSGWFQKMGYENLGRVKYWFRDDLPGIFFGKRNPYWPIGKGIPKNSGWDPEMADSESGNIISEKEYNQVMNDPGLAPLEKWGLNMIGRESVIAFNS